MTPDQDGRRALLLIKWVHTVVWVFFVAAILGIWLAALTGHFGYALVCIGVVVVEVVVLLLNRWHCPLTPLAARYTTDRRANFDIFLPEWLARYNKEIFGALFLGGTLFALGRWWLGQPGH